MSNNDISTHKNNILIHFNKCSHKTIKNPKNKKYSFCQDCGGIIMKENSKNYFIIKPISLEKELDEDPVQLVNIMKERDPISKEKIEVESSYLKKRKSIISDLQKLSIKMKYSDSTFYRTLYYLDNILGKMSEISIKKTTYFTLAYFLISGKFNEIDIFEPDLNDFFDFSDKIKLSIEEICKYEMLALQLIDYNVIIYSTYDWLMVLLNNGFIFENEIENNSNNIINNIYNYIKKSLAMITSRSFFVKYHPLQIAFSLIHFGREKFIEKNDEKYFLFIQDIYNIKFSDYEDCLEEVKNEFSENKKKDKKTKKKKRNENKENLSLSNNVFFQSVDKKPFSHTQISINKLEDVEKSDLIFSEKNEENNSEINEKGKERRTSKHMSTKFEKTLDIAKMNNSSKTKNSFVNDIDKINSIGTFGDKHDFTRREPKLKGTIINDEKEVKYIKQKVNEKKKNISKFKPNK